MINLGVICPQATDATSYYRGIGPFAEMRRSMQYLNIVQPTDLNWASLKLLDCLFMQRPFTQGHLKAAEIAKSNKVPLWVDFDDDLFSVPEYNPCAHIYGKPDVQKSIATICAMADVVTVSTPALAAKLAALNSNIKVVPNALDDRLHGKRPQRAAKGPDEGRLVMWRGSATHRGDLKIAAEACVALAQNESFKNWTWFFIGDSPWFADYMPKERCICAQPIDPIEYWQLLAKLQPDLFIVPLEHNEFNQSKSNIAWIEATWSGAAAVVPAMPEWEQPGSIVYGQTPDDFAEVLTHALSMDSAAHLAQVEDSWHAINNNLLLSKVNSVRERIILEVISGEKFT